METVLSVVAIAISVISGVFALYTFIWTARRDRKQATLDAYNRLQEQALDQLNQYKLSEIKEIAEKPRSKEYKEISSYVARIEHFCVGVKQRIYDRKTVYKLAHGYFDGALRMWIDPIIKTKNCSGIDYYENIHSVYEWMDKKTKKNKEKSH